MSSCTIPKGVCDGIEKVCKRFICREENEQRKFHPISWEENWQPKREGGLGLRSMRDINLMFMMKATKNLCCAPTPLSESVIHVKYNTSSNYWKGISSNWDTFGNNLMWKLGNGESTHLWEDIWNFNDTLL